MCLSCTSDINDELFEGCGFCLRPTAGASQLCSHCRAGSRLDELWCVAYRSGPLKDMIDGYKFRGEKQSATVLADLLDNSLPKLDIDAVCCLPTNPSHVRQLGFDHAELIASRLAKRRAKPFIRPLERTTKDVQHKSDKKERLHQSRRMMRAKRPVDQTNILLVDDIMTTGASMMAAAYHLKRAGAERVYGVVVARQPLDETAHLW